MSPRIIKAEDVYPVDRVTIREVGLRDGIQIVKKFPSTEAKEAWIDADYRAGVKHFEAGSYLPAKYFPQFEDVDILINKIASLKEGRSSVLVLNKKGAMRGLEGNADELTCVLSASEEHNLRNAKRSRKDSLREISEVLQLRDEGEAKPLVSVGIAMAFGCSIQGEVDVRDVLEIAEHSVKKGADLIGIADTAGYANPKQVTYLIKELRSAIGDIPLIMHFHDTRGTGIANIAAALNSGAYIFDASLGGLGGCPFAPNATGNVVLEDVAYLCNAMGFHTGIDIEVLFAARRILEKEMPDEPLYGALVKAGLPKTYVKSTA